MGIVLPAFVGSFVFGILTAISSLGVALFDFIPAFLMVGIQSVIYSFVMEYLVNPHIESHVMVIVISALFGMLSAVVLMSGVVIFVGAVAGLIVGIVSRVLYLNTFDDDTKYWN